ncbi:phytanoyl-CoA dioxygenase family protein [Actinacidiphila yeochonensis]|uniref:phytanoyl-CoA dioxygenase family protein n=1 Tax=Actinacidiphila yeochonensis TaxID=89050 RepID=UPI000AEAAAA4|nr:phytanoyl-CoA dioxygenase family protein [Actinacidiphila yeochonensis]
MSAPIEWTSPGAARTRAARIVAEQRTLGPEIVRNPHLSQPWARAAVRALAGAARSVIGPAVAVENTFLVITGSGHPFEIPWHQDGIGQRVELDPARSVSAWLALTDTGVDNGCLQVLPGSHRRGYLPYAAEAPMGAAPGQAPQAQGTTNVPDSGNAVPLPLRAGHAFLFDVRLLHRSGSAGREGARVGLNVRYLAPGGAHRRDPAYPGLDILSGSGW